MSACPSSIVAPWSTRSLREAGYPGFAVAALVVGFVAYWFWLRRAVGPAKCLAIGLVIHALGFVGIGWAYDVGLLFAATAVLFIAAPANLQYLYINGVVPPEKQGRLSGGIQIVGAVAAALGLGLGYSLWLGLKTSAEKGSRRTKRDWAVRRGVPEVFADSSLDISIARRHAIAAASSQCLIRAGGVALLRRGGGSDPRVDLAPQGRHPRARPARGLEEKGVRLRRGRVGAPAGDGVGVGRRLRRGPHGADASAINMTQQN